MRHGSSPAIERSCGAECRRAAVVATSVLAALAVATGVVLATKGDGDSVANELVYEMEADSPETARDVADRNGLTLLESIPRWRMHLARVASGDDVASRVDALEREEGIVRKAEPHRIAESPEGVQETIADLDLFGSRLAFETQPAAVRIRADAAHTVRRGDGVVVAIIDTSTSLHHPALEGIYLNDGIDIRDGNADAGLIDNGTDDDQDGLIDESSNHATHVAGLVHLSAPGAKILPIRALEEDGRGSSFAVARGILRAIDANVDVISLSIGTSVDSRVIERAVEDAHDAGITVVVASGNGGTPSVDFPANLDEAIAVASVDPEGAPSAFTNHGPEVDLAAPGESLLSMYGADGWARWSGTSFAAPLVAGAVALVVERYPGVPVQEVRRMLCDSASPHAALPRGFDGTMGCGVLDLEPLVEQLASFRVVTGVAHDSAGTMVTWAPVRDATTYDLARGDVENLAESATGVVELGPLYCIADDILGTDNAAFLDPTVPAPGQCFFYVFRDDAPDGGTYDVDAGHEDTARVASTSDCAR